MIDVEENFAKQAVRRAAKAFLILALLLSGVFKLLGDQGMTETFARADFGPHAMTTVGMIQIGCAILLVSGLADRVVAATLVVSLALMLVFLAPAMTISILPLGLVLLACAIVLKLRRLKAEAKKASA